MAEPSDRQVFRFVVDGVSLGEDQQERVATAIQRAGLEALTAARADLSEPLVLGHAGLKFNPGWRGLWVLNGPLADELGPQIDELVQGHLSR